MGIGKPSGTDAGAGESMANLLVIDSEETVRRTIQAILEKAGYRVRATGVFDEAVDLIRESRPDLVLTNVFLRGIAGHQAMRQLKDNFPALRVLMMSGLPDEPIIHEWIAEDGFDVFPKPFTSRSLISKVQQMLDSGAPAH